MSDTPSSRRRGAFLLSILVVCAPLAPANARAADIAAARDTWIEARSPSFTILANTGERKAREVALSFERFRQALQQLRPDATTQHPVPLRVILFDDDRSFDPYKLYADSGRGALVGQFQHAAYADHILLNAHPRDGDALPVVYHEYVHAFLRSNFTGVPLWLEEGLAELYSTFAVEGGELLVGRAQPDHVRTLRERSFLPLAELFAADQRSPFYREGERVGIFYAQSWLLVHYVMIGGGERVAQMGAFLASIRGGAPAEEAFRTAFGRSMGDLEKELRGYVNTRTFRYLRVPVGSLGPEPAVTVRSVPAGEALYELGTALAMRGPETAQPARAHLEAAAAAGVADAWASLGYVEQRLGRRAEAAALYERARAAGAGKALSLVLQAQASLGPDATPASSLAARALLARALETEPGYAEAQALLGRSYVVGEEPPAEGIAALAAALPRLPGRADVAYDLAILRMRAGDFAGAEELIRTVVVPLGSAELARHAERALERARVKALVDPAIASGDLGRAEEALRTALADTRDAELRVELEARLAQAVAHRASADRFARFNAAVEVANSGRLHEAKKQLEALRSEATEPALQKAIDDVLAQIAGTGRR